MSHVQALPGQETPDGVPNFKMVLVGDGGTGMLRKTSRADRSRVSEPAVVGLVQM